jgi:hypothetical protein
MVTFEIPIVWVTSAAGLAARGAVILCANTGIEARNNAVIANKVIFLIVINLY